MLGPAQTPRMPRVRGILTPFPPSLPPSLGLCTRSTGQQFGFAFDDWLECGPGSNLQPHNKSRMQITI